MSDILHILINDESVDYASSDPSVFSFFDAVKRPFIQVKNAKQFDYLIRVLPDEFEVAIWVHPNASYRKSTNLDTPGEAAMTALALENVNFNIISRYPDDVSKVLLNDLGQTAIKLGSLYKEIKNAKTETVRSLRAKGFSMSKSLVKKSDIDIAIIAALYEDEFTSLTEFLEDEESVPGFETMKIAKLKGSTKKVLVDFQTKMGMVEATFLSTQILARFSPKYLIMVGVCGGRYSKGVRLLDIIVPSKVFDYQTGKYENGQFMPYLRVSNLNNKKVLSVGAQILKSMENHVSTPLKSKCRNITIRSRTMACGNIVVKTDGYLDETISNFDEETESVEMESFGVVRTTELLEDKTVKPLIIKAVMDYTEKDKGDKDKSTAAYFSACFTYFLIKDFL